VTNRKDHASGRIRLPANAKENYHLKFIDDYGLLAAETIDAIEKLNIIPVDPDLSFNLDL
jgi:hypothetical protein